MTMLVKQLLVLIVHTGEYEDAETHVVCAADNQARLDMIKNELEQRTKIVKGALDAMYAAQKAFHDRVPAPEYPLTKQIPKFPSDQKLITAEMRAEREAIKAENLAVVQPYQVAHAQWVQDCRAEMVAAFRKNCSQYPNIDPFEGDAYQVSTASYEIVQTEMMCDMV
jgi:hypothetical protein